MEARKILRLHENDGQEVFVDKGSGYIILRKVKVWSIFYVSAKKMPVLMSRQFFLRLDFRSKGSPYLVKAAAACYDKNE